MSIHDQAESLLSADFGNFFFFMKINTWEEYRCEGFWWFCFGGLGGFAVGGFCLFFGFFWICLPVA